MFRKAALVARTAVRFNSLKRVSIDDGKEGGDLGHIELTENALYAAGKVAPDPAAAGSNVRGRSASRCVEVFFFAQSTFSSFFSFLPFLLSSERTCHIFGFHRDHRGSRTNPALSPTIDHSPDHHLPERRSSSFILRTTQFIAAGQVRLLYFFFFLNCLPCLALLDLDYVLC